MMKRTNKDLYLFGIHAITESILSGQRTINKIWLKSPSNNPQHKKLYQLAKKHQIPCSHVPLAKLNRLTQKKHQGVVALPSPIHFANLAHIIQATYEQGKTPHILLLDEIQDTHNLGAIARTALATGVDAIVVTTHNSAPISGQTMKASAGALVHMPICRTTDLSKTIAYLQESGLQIIACTEKATATIYEVDLTVPTAILLGSEQSGIHAKLMKMTTIQAKIPMQGPIGSLNVSVAAAVVLYEHQRQQIEGKKILIPPPKKLK